VAWEIEVEAGARLWYRGLEGRELDRAATLLDALAEHGPTLRGPLCKRIRHSRHHQMKELRSVGGHMRILFAFDPRRRGIVLVGGDKSGDWEGWYRYNIPLADRLFDIHLRNMGGEGPWRSGGRSGARDR
jgi:hypothetical protein